jgi:hypothetical protein
MHYLRLAYTIFFKPKLAKPTRTLILWEMSLPNLIGHQQLTQLKRVPILSQMTIQKMVRRRREFFGQYKRTLFW